MDIGRGILLGAAAGGAGTTALNAVTYLDMAVRGRPSSTSPQDTIERLAKRTNVQIPGEGEVRKNRIAGLGPMTGLATGVGVGVVMGVATAAGWRPGLVAGTLVATVAALVASNGPMTVLGVTDPRTWSLSDWTSDLLPHIAFGGVTAAVLRSRDGQL
jgi:hypothetical protein